jgi:hypothetical protein
MRYLRNIAWNTIALASALIFAVSAVLAVRSFCFLEECDRTLHVAGPVRVDRITLKFSSYGGGFVLSRVVLSNSDPSVVATAPFTLPKSPIVQYWQSNSTWYVVGDLRYPHPPPFNWLVFRCYRHDASSGFFAHRWIAIAIPYWSVLLASGILPWLALVRLRRQFVARRQARRRLLGQCIRCAYDLRATPARCPECGAVQAGI